MEGGVAVRCVFGALLTEAAACGACVFAIGETAIAALIVVVGGDTARHAHLAD